MRRTIHSREFAALLADETRLDEALGYFEPVQTEAFTWKYRLRPDVEVVHEAGEAEVMGAGILNLANALMRAFRRRTYRKLVARHPDRPRFVATGDSWFQHPLIRETIDHLMEAHGHPILSLDVAGDSLQQVVDQDDYLDAIAEAQAKALLLSGGGNDLMGGRFGEFLNPYTPNGGHGAARFLNSRFDAALATLFQQTRQIIGRVRGRFPTVKVLIHCYDYVVPRGRAAGGHWLGGPMEERGIALQPDKNAIVKLMIDRYAAGIAAVCKQFAGGASLVDTRGAIGAPQWRDEVHANDAGYAAVAARWQAALQAAGLA